MFEHNVDIGLLAYSVSAAAHGLLLGSILLRRGATAALTGRSAALLQALLWVGLAWSVLGAWSQTSDLPTWAHQLLVPLVDLARYAALLGFVLSLLLGATRGLSGSHVRQGLAAVVVAAVGAVLALVMIREFSTAPYSEWARPLTFAWLAMAIVGLMLVEQLLRNTSGDARWSLKPLCLGLGVILLFDLYFFSQAALFRQFDSDAAGVRPLVHSLAIPLFWVGSRRQIDLTGRLHVSRAAAFHSATMLLAGAYLLLVSAVGYYVRYYGGDWGRAMQIALISVGLVTLLFVLLSGAMRAKLRVYISKHFFSYRYDYREEWLKFTAMLASQQSPQALGDSVIQGLANLLESPAGALWLRHGDDGLLRQAARWNLPEAAMGLSMDSPLMRYLAKSHWIIMLDEVRRSAPQYEGLILPDWMATDDRFWLLLPLEVRGQLTGIVILGRPRAALDVNWEIRDLLRTAGSQAAGYLAQMQATEALLEARKFEAFNKMSAFVVHDLKNIVTQLSLMMKNARRLRDNPEFQEDMLSTVENSLEKMRQLMLQLREGDKPHGGARGVELMAIAQRLSTSAQSKGRTLRLDIKAPLHTRGHAERIERVIGHVVQNAFDATPESGDVWLSLSRLGSSACIEVGDTGCGMSEEFVRNRLFKPFETTKSAGMGIGAYESFQYLQELGGKIQVQSQPGKGTLITILLPLLHAGEEFHVNAVGAA